MKFPKIPPTLQFWITTERLQQAIGVVAFLLGVFVLTFAGYYYWDRYHARSRVSPAEQAIALAEQAVREDPSDPQLRVSLAALYYENYLYGQALKEAQEVLKAYPNNDNALLIAGMANIRLGKREDALPYLEQFIALRKVHPTAKADMQLEMAEYFLGESYIALGQSEKALKPLEDALIIVPTDADALYQLGLAYRNLGRYQDALKQFQQAVRLVPDFTEAYQGMEDCYLALGDEDALRYARGMVAYGQGDYQTARAQLVEAASQRPNDPQVWLDLGLTYEKLGDLQAALEALTKAIKLAPHDLAIQQAYGRVQAALNALQSQEATP